MQISGEVKQYKIKLNFIKQYLNYFDLINYWGNKKC